MNSEVLTILKKIEAAGFEVAAVGGGVRDLVVGNKAKDWDFTTNAKPQEILKLFPNAFYNNKFGTVGIPVKVEETEHPNVVEVTTYRTEGSYSDSRHPDEVIWGDSLEEDLKRRDFTINALALRFRGGKFDDEPVDLFGGVDDLKNKIIRAVGNANVRFGEDALRIIRAIRFATTLEFEIEDRTKKGIADNSKLILKVSGERIRDEIFKIVESENCDRGFFLARDLGILKCILPELDVNFAVEQKSPKRHHIYDAGTHCVMSMKHCPSSDTIVRFATLLHDIGKAKVAAITEEGVRTFFNHEVVGARMARDIATRLNLSMADRDKVFKLVRWHQFSVGENQTDKAIRRFINNVGLENVEDMMNLRIGDRLGGGLEEPESWRLKLFKKRIKEVLTQPFSVRDLKVNGRDVMEVLKIKPGPKVGDILRKLFEEVVEDSSRNEKGYLMKKLQEIQ